MSMRTARTIISFSFVVAFIVFVSIISMHPPKPARAASSFATIICDSFKPVSVSANTQIFTAGNSSAFIYICGYNLTNNNAAAQSVSLVEGTGAVCATGTLALIGNSTAAGGLAMPINGSVNLGSGTGAIARTAVAGDNVCLFTAAGPIGGIVAGTSALY